MACRSDLSGYSTKHLLLETAEKLFAEQGLESVSLRAITDAAGQRNTSALQYHFGSRESLIEAIFAYRMPPINARRMQMLDDLRSRALYLDLRSVVEARVIPLAEQLADHTSRGHWVRFLAQANLSPNVNVEAIIGGRYDHGLVKSGRMVRDILPNIPRHLLNARIRLSSTQMVYALAEFQKAESMTSIDSRQKLLGAFVNNLVDVIAGGLSAPATPIAMLETG